ncbi:hypothetical protein EVAR_92799_1 [Eumeta japonica]|uniref:Transposable element Tc1 transposase n=1 Tax=Eumeta variegata TaxID=151549 RepID=A0A4C2A1I5_EUMVA|nr:hypothetical protein EVAR_92799_1 [Eumeta japonica]
MPSITLRYKILIVREYLNNVFPNSWIGRDGQFPWPPRSPDLTPLDFYVWGRAKELVYATEVQNVEDLREWIEAAFQKIQQEMLLSMTTVEIRRRCRACIANGVRVQRPTEKPEEEGKQPTAESEACLMQRRRRFNQKRFPWKSIHPPHKY